MKHYSNLGLVVFAILFTTSNAWAKDSLGVRKLGEVYTGWNNVQKMTIAGGYAYVIQPDLGISIIDISQPKEPVEIGFVAKPNRPLAIAVSGDYAYVTDMDVGLIVLDVSEPEIPDQVASINSAELRGAKSIAIKDGYAYCGTTHLEVINISYPLIPYIERTVYNILQPEHLKVSGNRLYIGSGYNFTAASISSPATPIKTWAVRLDYELVDFTIHASHAYIADAKRNIQLHALGDPNLPSELFIWQTSTSINTIYAEGYHLYVTGQNGDLWIINIADVNHPKLAGTCKIGSRAYGFTKYGAYLYCMRGSGGLGVVDISDRTNPVVAGGLTKPNQLQSCTCSDSYLYLLDNVEGLKILDIDNSPLPTEIGSFPLPAGTNQLAKMDSYLFIACGKQGLIVLDICNPYQPVLAGTNDECELVDISVQGDYCYATSSTDGLVVFDISNPSLPLVVGKILTEGSFSGIAVEGNYAYITVKKQKNEGAGFGVWDISDPSHPTLSGFNPQVGTEGRPDGLVLQDGYAYIVDGLNGFSIVNVIDPTKPTKISTYKWDFQYAMGVDISDDKAFVTLRSSGLRVLDISKRLSPQEIGFYVESPSQYPNGVAIGVKNTVYVAQYEELGVYDFSSALNMKAETLLPFKASLVTYPNPFNSTMTVTFSLNQPTFGSLELFDISGRMVDTIFRGRYLSGGEHSFGWEARSVPAGSYLLRLTTGLETAESKVTILR